VSAPQTWRRFTLSVTPRDIEAASTLMREATGADVVVEEPGEDAPRHARVKVSAYLPEPVSAVVAGLYERSVCRALRMGIVRETIVEPPAIVHDEEWAESWKRFYRPFRIAPNLHIVPPWEAGYRASRGARILWMDPGMAFGTGQHPTTASALRLFLPFVRKGKAMIDIGCGSGILGIAAAQLGARVFASDRDRVAVAAARANFRANGVKPAALRCAVGVPGSFGRAPLVVANITADVLVRLAPDLARSVARGGTLVTSGVTRRGRLSVLKAFEACGLRLTMERRAGEWRSFAHRKV
jgi:ribosomal protein L11 methyltransferase